MRIIVLPFWRNKGIIIITRSAVAGLVGTESRDRRQKQCYHVTPFRGRKIKGQGHQADYCRDRKTAISSERKGLRTSNVVYGWSRYDEPHHRHARWPPSWKLWLAVQVITFRGWGYLAATQQAAQLDLTANNYLRQGWSRIFFHDADTGNF